MLQLRFALLCDGSWSCIQNSKSADIRLALTFSDTTGRSRRTFGQLLAIVSFVSSPPAVVTCDVGVHVGFRFCCDFIKGSPKSMYLHLYIGISTSSPLLPKILARSTPSKQKILSFDPQIFHSILCCVPCYLSSKWLPPATFPLVSSPEIMW